MTTWTPPTQSRLEGYFKELNNWGRWGNDDQRGTANLITAAKRAQAQALVRTGRTVSLSRDIGPQPAIMYNVTFPSPRDRADVVGSDTFQVSSRQVEEMISWRKAGAWDRAVIAVGGLTTVEGARQVLREGANAALVATAALFDPQFAIRFRQSRVPTAAAV